MAGIATYLPPERALTDVSQDEAYEAFSRLVARVAKRAGFEAAEGEAVARLCELIEQCA